MAILTVEGLSHAFGEKELYHDATFTLNKGEHIGVVGQNGTGKSTLIRILLGEIISTGGRVAWQKDVEKGHIDQHAQVDDSLSVREYLQTAFAELYDTERRLGELYGAMERGATQAQLRQVARLQAALEEGDFYSIDSRLEKVAAGLGLMAIGLERPLDTLSGGQRTKVILGKLLLRQPDVLLLDEPTNFLDAEHITWLAEYLTVFPGAFLIVSHDFAFLDRVTTGILDIEFQAVKKYNGRYSDFMRQKTQRRQDYLRHYAAQRREVERLESYIAKNKARASTARQARSRQHRLDHMELMAPPSVLPKPNIAFSALPATQVRPLVVEGLSVGYGAPLLPPISLQVGGGQKLAVTGFNGIGKSTLLKTLVGQLPALAGGYTFDSAVRVGYFEQDLRWEYGDMTPIQILEGEFPLEQPRQIRRALARCGVTAKHAMQPVRSLSGGEQNKVKLCCLTLAPYNFLILDEPTNHMDAETKESLREAIAAFPGAVLLVCHERAFYQGIVERVLDVEKMLERATAR